MTASDLDARLDLLVTRPSCRACAFLDSLDAPGRERLERLIALDGDQRIGSRQIAKVLRGLPLAPGRDALDGHRAGHA